MCSLLFSIYETETEKKLYRTYVKQGRKSSKKVCLELNQMGNNSSVGDRKGKIYRERGKEREGKIERKDRRRRRYVERFFEYFGSFAQLVISCCLVIHRALHANESVSLLSFLLNKVSKNNNSNFVPTTTTSKSSSAVATKPDATNLI